MFLKRLFLYFFGFSCVLQSFSQDYDISYNQNNSNLDLTFELKNYDFETVKTKQGIFTKIIMSAQNQTEENGFACLPIINVSLNVLKAYENDIEITEISYLDTIIENHILPSRGIIYRNQNFDSVPYFYNHNVLNSEDFYPQQNIHNNGIINFRGKQELSISIFPFQYKASEKCLRICKKICFHIKNVNKEQISLPDYEYGDLLVITPEKYDSVLQKYITWKREKGINVEVVFCDSAENVTNKISEAYNINPSLSYVQLVGNWDDVRSAELNEDPCYDCPSDPHLGCVAGNDDFPDLAISRFCCNNEHDLAVQTDKSINYEKIPNAYSDWREKFIGIGSHEGPGDDNELDYQHIQNIYRKLSAFTYNQHSQHYDYGTNTSSNALINSINKGASTIAYCGHGTGNYWLTGDYGVSSVEASSNIDQLPFIVSVACYNGAFHNTEECFAAKWLNTQHGGAVATLMSSINQPWQPPMRGQDYFYDLLIGGYNYDNDSANGISTSEQRTHWGALVLNTFYLMLRESSLASDIKTVKTWISFGDVCLQLRTCKPQEISSSERIIAENQAFNTIITAENQPISNALICISQDGRYYKGFTNRRGEATIPHGLQAGKALLVVTAFNTTTIYDSIPVISANQPYLEIIDYSPKIAKSGTNTHLVLDIKNYGNATADSVKLLITTNENYAEIINSEIFFDSIPSNNQVQTTTPIITFQPNLPFGQKIILNTQLTYNDIIANKEIEISLSNQECYLPDSLHVEQRNDSCIISWSRQVVKPFTIFDDFETNSGHAEFDINSPGNTGWTYNDLDSTRTKGISNYKFKNAKEQMAFIVVNPAKIYSGDDTYNNIIRPHSGEQFLVSFASSDMFTNTNDMIISPLLNFTDSIELTFFVRGSTDYNCWETLKVFYYTDSAVFMIDSCTVKGNDNPDFWTEKRYTISPAAKYIGIANISNNKNFLCLDDIKISGNAIFEVENVEIYDNGNLVLTQAGDTILAITDFSIGEHCLSLGLACDTLMPTDTLTCFAVLECLSPSEVECYRSETKDSLSWLPVDLVERYNIYADDSLIASTNNTHFEVDSTNTNRIYSVSADCIFGDSERVLAEVIITSQTKETECSFTIYPNPSNGLYCVDYQSRAKDLAYKVYDICGRLILEGKLVGGRDFIDMQVVQNGVYTLTLEFEEGRKSVLIIKQ